MAVQLFKELIDGNGHLEIPESVRKILPNTLMNCEKLTSVSIPRSVTIICACSFLGSKNLRRVELREGLRTIDVAAFMGCSNLESIVIPEDWHYWCAMVSITDDCLISFKVDRE